jgi:ubiquitin C-terminal hydrolase
MYPGDETKDMSRMFDNMFKEEHISERICDHCHGRAPATKNTTICMYPDVLVCSFSRFEMTPSGETRKRHDAIDIPFYIKPVQINRQYSLCSIGNHVGSLHGGHYYAMARNPDGSWHNYDDICISPVRDIQTMIKNNKDAYMLFYELEST